MHKITTTQHAMGPQTIFSSSLGFVVFVLVSRLFHIDDEVWQSRISLIDDVLTILTRNDVSAQEHEIIVVMIAAMQVGWKLEEIQYQHPQKLLGCFPLPLYLITLFQTPSTVRIQMPLLPQVSF